MGRKILVKAGEFLLGRAAGNQFQPGGFLLCAGAGCACRAACLRLCGRLRAGGGFARGLLRRIARAGLLGLLRRGFGLRLRLPLGRAASAGRSCVLGGLLRILRLRALLGGKVALIEVTSALTVDQCWELVEASEKYKVPCMQLENCVYGEIELLELNLARMGMFGEITHVEGAYIHDLRGVIPQSGPNNGEWRWRYGENMAHRGDRYPTHGLVPLAQTLGINRGDRFDYLVALGNGPHNRNYERVRREYLPDTDSRKFDPPAAMADMNTTLLKTVNGVSVLVQHDVSSPRPYNRKAFISGTKGAMGDYPFRCTFEEKCMDGRTHQWFDAKQTEEIRTKYAHPLWRDVSAMAKKVGGHGGMDFIMDLRWAYCLQNGLPLDMDVYDLAATSCLCELTETSDRNGSKPMPVPDFTRGNWRNVAPWGVVTVDLKKMGLDGSAVKQDDAALSV